MEKKTASIKEVGRVLGIGRSLTFKLINSGEIPSIRLGRRILVPVAALEKIVASKQ
jgi:excisionase family DNA binding protein